MPNPGHTLACSFANERLVLPLQSVAAQAALAAGGSSRTKSLPGPRADRSAGV